MSTKILQQNVNTTNVRQESVYVNNLKSTQLF